MKTWLVLALLALPMAAEAKPTLSVWTRAPGTSAEPAVIPPPEAKLIDLGAKRSRDSKLYDPQYGAEALYRGIALDDLLANLPGGPAFDQVLLRFDNGMVIPISRWPEMDDSPFLALAHSSDGTTWSTTFEALPKKGHPADDPRPIRFTTNKLVYRGADARELPDWSPWRHVSSLVGIELVNAVAWTRQFALSKDGRVTQGLEVFERYCSACHGVRGVGARFGWDVVTPIPMTEHRSSPGVLYFHVKYRELDAAKRGFMMPALSPVTEDEVTSLWKWLDLAAKEPLRPYTPPVSR
jgi:hypothetical protein